MHLLQEKWKNTYEIKTYYSSLKYTKLFNSAYIKQKTDWEYLYTKGQEISKIYEDNLGDEKLKKVGKKLRFQFEAIKQINKNITPKEIIKARKEFRTSVIVRNIYSEVLNIIQATVMNKISNKRYKPYQKKYLEDALMTSIAGISAAMKNTG